MSLRASVLATLTALAVLTAPIGAAPPASDLYADAQVKEQLVRTALAAPDAPTAILKAARTVVDEYTLIVRSYPTSGYCDDALWQGGQLALAAYAKFGDLKDRTTGVRLLQSLQTEYPASKFVKDIPAAIERASALVPSAPPTVRPVVTAPAAAPVSAAPVATITDIRRMLLPDVVRVIIQLDGEVSFHEERLADPPRIYVDLSSTRVAPSLADQTIRFDGDAGGVRQVRLGRQPNDTTRVVLDAVGVSSFSVYPLYNPFRLVIDCTRPPQQPGPAVHPAATSPAPTEAPTPQPRPSTEGRGGRASTPPPTANTTGTYSVARQLGLGVSKIVIDPGHGGHDPGAEANSVIEAELVLDLALRLEALLAKVPGVEVVLTRRTDDFVPLEARTAIANREHADLFLSIHANASTNKQARGIESYFLNMATNATTEAVAARENATSGQAMGDATKLVAAILTNNKRDESRDLATVVQRKMVDTLGEANKNVRDLGVKQAPFVVLIGAAMPSVLSEVSFLTNTQDAKLLRTPSYRQRIATALFDAIRAYQASLKSTSTIGP